MRSTSHWVGWTVTPAKAFDWFARPRQVRPGCLGWSNTMSWLMLTRERSKARVPIPRPLGNILRLGVPVWSHPYWHLGLPGLITSSCLTSQFDHSRVLDIPVWSRSCAWHPSFITSYFAICWIHVAESCSAGSAKEKNWAGERSRKYFFWRRCPFWGIRFWNNNHML